MSLFHPPHSALYTFKCPESSLNQLKEASLIVSFTRLSMPKEELERFPSNLIIKSGAELEAIYKDKFKCPISLLALLKVLEFPCTIVLNTLPLELII